MSADPSPAHAWPAGDGEMAGRIRAFDWAATPLGSIAGWPERMRGVVDAVLSCGFPSIALWGPDLVQVYNDGYAAVMGRKHPGGLGQATRDCWPEVWHINEPIYARVRAGETVSLTDALYPIARRGAVEDAWFTLSYSPLPGGDGGVAGVLVTLFETTAEHLSDGALRDSEERYRAFVTASSDVVYRMSPDWAEMRQLDGRGFIADMAEPSWSWMDSYIHPDDQAAVRAAIDRAIAGRSIFELEHRVIRVDGTLGWTLSRAVPILAKDGGIVEWLGAAKDVTARREAEDERRARASAQAFLLRFGDALRAEARADAIADLAVRMLADELGVDRCYATTIDPAEDRADFTHRFVRPGAPPLPASIRPSDFPAELEQIFTRTLVVDDATGGPGLDEADRRSLAALRFGALIAAMVRRGAENPIWGIVAVSTEPRRWTGAEVALAEEAAERTWAATERARADAALRESEERFRTLADVGPQLVWYGEGPGADFYNRRWYDYTGLTEAESLEPEGWRRVVHPDDLAEAVARSVRSLGTGEPYQAEYRLQRADGAYRWHIARAFRVPGGSRWVGAATDVDDLKRAEEELRESETRLRRFGEASSDVLWIRDARTLQWEYLTPAFEEIYGLSCEEGLSGENFRGWAELIVPEDRAHAIDMIRRVREGETVTFDYRIRRPSDGEVRWLRNSDFPIFEDGGAVTRIGGIGKDVTALKEAEAAVAGSEERLRTLMEGIPQLVWRSCAEGRWTWASPQWCDFTGQNQERSRGLGWMDAIHPDDRSATVRAWEKARGDGMLDVEYRVRRAADGAWVWHHSRSLPVRDADGRIVEWLGTTTDIQALRELQERQGVLVAELQHRTRNLIGVVRAVADKSMEASADLPDFRERFGHRMQALSRVQGLLSRLGDGDRVAFDELLRAELTAMGAADDPRVALDGPDGVALRSGSVQTLALAIHELATNAVKYGALRLPDARLRIAWRVLPPDGRPRPRLAIEWRESGVPMPAAEAAPRDGGQGRELIERALPYQLDAETSFALGPDGVNCTIVIPVSARTDSL